jgi:hypothetical protein
MGICMQTPLLSLLLNLVLSVGKVMLPIEDLMVDGGCIATTGGRRLFCIYILYSVYMFTCVLLGLNILVDSSRACMCNKFIDRV